VKRLDEVQPRKDELEAIRKEASAHISKLKPLV